MKKSGIDPRPSLLIVDDQAANIRQLAAVLEDTYELFVATTGKKALEISRKRDIDLVLLDVLMPEMDGFEVCRRLRSDEKTKAIPVIFVTAMNDVEDETRGFDVGGIDYITKPISPPTVRARVKTHLELKRTRDLLEELASIDPLTGVANRRLFDQHLTNEWRRAVRSQTSLSLLLVDVDFFKQFNDNYGHSRGDECLKRIAASLLATAGRPSDLVARYGGEEFGIVLPETASGGASSLMDRLLANIRNLEIQHAYSAAAQHVTVSVGGVTVVPSSDFAPSQLIAAADKLLYQAKEDGRNRGVHLDLKCEDTARALASQP